MNMKLGDWEAVIGLEIHSELNTKSKLFSSAPNRFGDEPNTNISEVCTGQPGSLPVLNKEAVKKAVQFGCAINAHIAEVSKFDRKSYFYPDSPRNFQITQMEEPIILGGTIIAEVDGKEMSFAVNRVHLEDDAGTIKHFSKFAGVDYNRAGVPLIEIVSEPCIRSSKEAVAYAMAVRAILQYIDVSDCNMEEGSLRFDANVSVRKKGETNFRNKIEIKNMNSFSYMQIALDEEIKRQIKAYESNIDKPIKDVIQQATYRWDLEKKAAVLMRNKEDADDYRYFPEPDLPLIVLSKEYIEEIRSTLPELPLQRERRYVHELGLSLHTAFILISDKPVADYFEKVLKFCNNAKAVCNWIIVEFAGRLKESGKLIYETEIPPESIATLINMIDDGTINGKIAKAIADEIVKNPERDPRKIVSENPDYQPMDNHAEIEAFVSQVIDENPQSIKDYKDGRDKAFAFLVGQVMRLSKGKAPPVLVNKLILEKIEKSN